MVRPEFRARFERGAYTMFAATIHTKMFGLLGNPLGQSAASFMHNSVYQEMGIDALYHPIEIPLEYLAPILLNMEKFNFGGTGVTMPYKTQAHKYLDGLADSAKYTEVVNTVSIEPDGRKIGHNTDGSGFVQSLEEPLGLKIPDHRYLILGSGGAATAIACELAARGAGHISSLCITRDYFCAETLYSRVNKHFEGVCRIAEMNDKNIKKGLEEHDVIIHATKVGLHPHCDETLFDPAWLSASHKVCDVVYVPVETKLLREAARRGCRTLSGLWMNVNQAAEQMRLWLGIEPPLDFMYRCGMDYLISQGKAFA